MPCFRMDATVSAAASKLYQQVESSSGTTFFQALLVRQPLEGLDRQLGIGKVREWTLLQLVDGGAHPLFPHEGGDDRLVRGPGRCDDRIGGLVHVRHGLGREDHEHAVHVGVLGRLFEHGRIALRRGVADHVHGIEDRGIGRQLSRPWRRCSPGSCAEARCRAARPCPPR